MRQSLPLCRSLVASGFKFELPSCDADEHWQARMTPARLLHATRSVSRSHTSIGLLPERTITCRLLLFRRHRAHTCQHRKHRDADSTGPESPTAGPPSVPPGRPHPRDRRQARGGRPATAGPPGATPKPISACFMRRGCTTEPGLRRLRYVRVRIWRLSHVQLTVQHLPWSTQGLIRCRWTSRCSGTVD